MIKPIQEKDKKWVTHLLIDKWGSTTIISRGKKHDASLLKGFIYFINNKPQGLITHNITSQGCEIVTLNSLLEKKGIGTKLIETIIIFAREKKCKRVWIVTTNDNISALYFYQKRGFYFKMIYPNAIKESRKLKPEIPLIGENGIPIKDELELEIIV